MHLFFPENNLPINKRSDILWTIGTLEAFTMKSLSLLLALFAIISSFSFTSALIAQDDDEDVIYSESDEQVYIPTTNSTTEQNPPIILDESDAESVSDIQEYEE